jgi:hypothetical protein
MNIKPVQSEAVALPAKAKASVPAKASDEAPEAATEANHAERKRLLMEALATAPNVRPEVIERAKTLANDPNYPTDDVLNRLAARFLGGK